MGGLTNKYKGLSGVEADLSGYVSGPSSATDSNIPTFSGTTGKIIQDSGKSFSTDGTFASNSDNLIPSQKAIKTYVDSSVVGLLDDRGNYDASGNTFPASGGSGSAGAILKGDIWRISVAGTLGGVSVSVGDWIRSLVDTPGQTASNWAISEGTDSNGNISANNFVSRYTPTATAAGTTTLTVSSSRQQHFTGSTTQTCTLPVTSTLDLGWQYEIVNLSSGVVTVQSSGGNTLQAMAANTRLVATCILTSGTGTASWNWDYLPVQSGLPIATGASASLNSLTFSSTSGIIGTTTNDNAAAGSVGEYISSSVPVASAVTLTTGIGKTITSITLTAGDWDVSGMVVFSPSTTSNASYFFAGISTTNNTIPVAGNENNVSGATNTGGAGTFGAGIGLMPAVGPTRLSLSGNTSVYLVGQSGFTGTMSVYGFIGARRAR